MTAFVWRAIDRSIDGPDTARVCDAAPFPARIYRGTLEELQRTRDKLVARLLEAGKRPLVEEWEVAGVPLWTLTWYSDSADAAGDDARNRADRIEVWQILKEET